MSFFKKTKYVFNTNLDIDKCKLRLEILIDDTSFTTAILGSKSIVGKIKGNKFHLMKRTYCPKKNEYEKNSFAPFFYGRFIKKDNGVEIRGYFSMNPVVKVFVIFCLSFLLVLGGIAFVQCINEIITGNRSGEGSPYAGLIVLPGMLLAIIFTMKYGRKDKEKFILDFIQDALENNIILN